jgi:hypothetical protein
MQAEIDFLPEGFAELEEILPFDRFSSGNFFLFCIDYSACSIPEMMPALYV